MKRMKRKAAESNRVEITDINHPHYGERGKFTGYVIEFKHWPGKMAEIKLDNCRHGTDTCFVSPEQIKATLTITITVP